MFSVVDVNISIFNSVLCGRLPHLAAATTISRISNHKLIGDMDACDYHSGNARQIMSQKIILLYLHSDASLCDHTARHMSMRWRLSVALTSLYEDVPG